MDYFAPCPAGVESLLTHELRSLRLGGVRRQRSGVTFSGPLSDGYRALLWSRLATRVLLTLDEVDASSSDTFYRGVKAIPWESHVMPTGTIAVGAAGTNNSLRNTQFVAVRAKDAVADRFREHTGERPSVDAANPDVRINVVVRGDRAIISVDLAGQPLHRRGYRAPGVQVEAPMKETLAAAVLAYAGWARIAADSGALVDPMCGSGTLAIEAALAAGDVAPGLLRRDHPVTRWQGHDADAWAQLYAEAERRRVEGRDRIPRIEASDSDPIAVGIARDCVGRAGLDGIVQVLQRELEDAAPPKRKAAPSASRGAQNPRPGLLVTNPPWAVRLGRPDDLPDLHARLGRLLRERFEGWRLAVVSPDPALANGLRLNPQRSMELGMGKGAARVTVFQVPSLPSGRAGAVREPERTVLQEPGGSPAGERPFAAHAPRRSDGAREAFENRLRKMARHRGTWARRAGVSCYRVYDADLPDYSVAIDVYAGAGPDLGKRWIHVAEYAPPPEVSVNEAAARLVEVVDVVPDIFGVERSAVFLKQRKRQRGTTQYDRLAQQGTTGVVEEAGLVFEVNLTDYLDTGLFLDHRNTRAWIRELAEATRFLNLFAYTGTATVFAAAGGASSTTTVDLSATYLEWAGRNMDRNGFSDARHSREQADVFPWLRNAAADECEFDLVFCDAPTFSTSKRMTGTWDVQRDHPALLTAVAAVLAPGGSVLFSTNRRQFSLDTSALGRAGLAGRDVTRRTIPPDFERRTLPHRCWMLKHAKS